MSRILLAIILSILLFSSVSAQMMQVRQFVREGSTLLEDKEFDLALAKLQKADSLLPNHPIILRLMAVASAQSTNPQRAFKYLSTLAIINAKMEVLDLEAFDGIRTSKQFENIISEFDDINSMISLSDTAFTLDDKLLHPEGIEYDESSNTFYLTSIHKGKVISKRESSAEQDLITSNLMAASGIKIDKNQNWLWVSTGALDEWQGYTEELKGQSKVVKFDLQSGEKLDEYLAEDEKRHYFGDIVIRPGTSNLYVTDSRHKAIYMIDPDSERLNLVKEFENFISLQGLSFSEDGNTLFFADYRYGLFSMEMSTGEVTPFEATGNMSLRGIDGLYYYDNSLIAVQNGLSPNRITQIYLNEDHSEIEGFRYLEKANPVLDEPTLGVLVGSHFYYVANSSWPRYDQDGNIGSESIHPIPVIMKVNLKEN